MMCFINSSLHLRMVGWIGDKKEDLELHLYSDADWAGDRDGRRSTSGVFLCLKGPNSFVPLCSQSKKQGCVSSSTPEAEIVAINFAIRTTGIKALDLWETLLGRKRGSMMIIAREDNESCIAICKSGKNPTMTHLERTHDLHMSWLHDQFRRGQYRLQYTPTDIMCADIFTKAFPEKCKWLHATELIGIINTSLNWSGTGANRPKRPTTAPALADVVIDRRICEWCCGPQSRIGSHKAAKTNCSVTRITEAEDATTDKGLSLARGCVQLPRCLLFSSMPCTGGSPWQRINVRKPGGFAILRKHKILFDKLWTNFEKLCHYTHVAGNKIAIEWPRGCSYWLLPKVVKLCKLYNLQFVDFDGCMLGLTSIYDDKPIKKPWRIATNDTVIAKAFEGFLCQGHAEHHPCAGKDTKLTENYTPLFVDMLHNAFRRSVNDSMKHSN